MSDHFKIEFCFRRKDIEGLLSAHPHAKRIIIRQEIKPRKNPDGKGYINVTTITAHAQGAMTRSLEQHVIKGCPSPPGCDEEDDI